ncbi:MAG: glycoside hydrolase family 16 protein [Lewinella sp.]|nr:glycoside hydrolase family 16 protein [Lewinella sp.]
MATSQLIHRFRWSFSLGLLLLFQSCQVSAPRPYSGAKLVWSDEFATEGLPDADKWDYEVGDWGWGNNELQNYTREQPANARVEAGRLLIEAHRSEAGDYTSARLVTRGKQTWTYGYIEARAKLPGGRGTWPAIWMLGENIKEVGWPRCGEIDIMEHVGFEPDSIWGSIHCTTFNHVQGTQKTAGLALPNSEQAFHVYAIDWNTQRIHFLVDGEIYYTFWKVPNATVAEWPFDAPHFLLLNLAVGGNWGGQRGVDETIWPQRMEVDWVRVWQ